MSALLIGAGRYMVPSEGGGPTDWAVGANFERFNGLGQLDNGGGAPTALGANYGPRPAPGRVNQPVGQTYTEGPLTGLTNTLGGEPLSAAYGNGYWMYRGEGTFTPAHFAQRLQFRIGQGQHYKASQGVAQTVQLASITNNPPQPDDLSNILSAWG